MPNCIVCEKPLTATGRKFGMGTMQPEATWLPEYTCENPDCDAKGSIQLVKE